MTRPKIERRELDGVAAAFLTGDAAPATTRETDTPPAPPAAPAAPAPLTGDVAGLASREQVDNLAEQVAALAARGPVGDTLEAHPLAQYRSWGEYALAAFHGDADPDALTRAWVDQTSPDNPGVIPPSWATEVHGIVDLGRRMIAGTGGAASAGESGLSMSWPYFDGDLSALVAAQTAEKTEIHSVKVSLKKGSADLRTFAGGSDLSLQIIERGSPSYLDAYLRIMGAAYGAVTDAAFCADLLTAGGAATEWDPAVKGSFEDAVVVAALQVEAATGSAPTVVGIGRDIYAAVANARDADGRRLYPFVGPSNADGVPTSIGALTLNIAGIAAVPVAGLTGKVIVTNGAAARWVEDGPRNITAPDVPKLGRDVAVYGFADTSAYVPAGVVVLAPKAA